MRQYSVILAALLRLCLCGAILAPWPAAAAPQTMRAARAPLPQSRIRPPRRPDDNIGRLIKAAEPSAKPALPAHLPRSAAPTPPAEPDNFIRERILQAGPAPKPELPPHLMAVPAAKSARAAPGNPPVPQPAPKNAAAADSRGNFSGAAEPAPDFTAPIPIPVPMPAPAAGPNAPAALPETDDSLTAPAARYESAPKTPLTYAPSFSAARFAPRFGDRKPHIWTSRRKPWHYAIHGSDVSWHNQTIDWTEMARSGISFVFIKATEGGDYLDPAFKQNWQAAKLAGLARGAYHFYYFCRPAKDQLKWYIHNVPRDRSAMPPVLDIEWNHTSPTCRRRPPAAEVQRDMEVFLRGVEKYYGKKPIIYTTVDFFRDSNLGVFRNKYPFWLRSVAAHPDDRYNGHPWLFWQYTGTGRVPGIAGDTDISVFAGSARQWQSWLRGLSR